MAYASQAKKQQILAALKGIIPAGWKWSLAVNSHSTFVLTIYSAPVDLLAEMQRCCRNDRCVDGGYARINPYYIEVQFDTHLDLFKRILAAMNDGNHDRSDPQTDYFDVGWYVDLNLGRWDKPFVCTAPAQAEPAAAIAAACVARGLPADKLVVAVVR